MKKNVGKTDKIVRVLIASVIASLCVVYNSWWGLLAVIPLIAVFTTNCPLYLPFGISTLPKKKQIRR